jgi:hypothetical protein
MATRRKSPVASDAALHAGRFAHPFYTPLPPAERQPVAGMTRMTDWSKKQLGPVPAVARAGVMTVAEVIGELGVAEIQTGGEIRFHALGDSGGVGMVEEIEQVGDDMATDYTPTGGSVNPAFMLHLGDVIYGTD